MKKTTLQSREEDSRLKLTPAKDIIFCVAVGEFQSSDITFSACPLQYMQLAKFQSCDTNFSASLLHAVGEISKSKQ